MPRPVSPRTLVAATLALALLGAAPVASAAPPAKLWTEKSFAKPLDPDAPVSMRAFSTLAAQLSPAVVNVLVDKKARRTLGGWPGPFGAPRGQGQGLGTGFIIHADGYALTNNHVVEDADTIKVRLANDAVYPAQVVGTDPKLDVALIKFEAREPLTVAPLGNSNDLLIGEWVVAIGNPFGLSHTVTAGIVSAKGRRDIQPGNRPMYANFIQTDASINPGNSGGPLINIRGEVVGINTAINAAGQGIGFAVPVNMVKVILPQLASGRVERSYLGVKIAEVPRELASRHGLRNTHGALVQEVVPGTPAEVAGIQAGDVITHWDGKALEHWGDLPWLASTAGAGRKVAVKVHRNKRSRTVQVLLAPFPTTQPASGRADSGAAPKSKVVEDIGIRVGLVPKALRAEMRLKGAGGILVLDVDRGSPADQAGLEPGDIVVQVNYEDAPGSLQAFEKAVARVPKGKILSLLVRRGERRIFVAFTK